MKFNKCFYFTLISLVVLESSFASNHKSNTRVDNRFGYERGAKVITIEKRKLNLRLKETIDINQIFSYMNYVPVDQYRTKYIKNPYYWSKSKWKISKNRKEIIKRNATLPFPGVTYANYFKKPDTLDMYYACENKNIITGSGLSLNSSNKNLHATLVWMPVNNEDQFIKTKRGTKFTGEYTIEKYGSRGKDYNQGYNDWGHFFLNTKTKGFTYVRYNFETSNNKRRFTGRLAIKGTSEKELKAIRSCFKRMLSRFFTN